MASAANPGNYGEFSVIIRPRPGVPCSLSTQGIITQISEHLASYKCVCNIAFNSGNFVVHLPTLELQLQILSRKTFIGSNYVLDIVPWCHEYESFNLPWLFITSAECIEIHRAAQNICQNSFSANLPSGIHNINAELQNRHLSSSKKASLLDDLNKIWVAIPQPEQSSEISKDFSYLMISELRTFYHAKIETFGVCKQICKEMHSIALQFYNQVENIIEKIYKETSKYNDMPPEDALSNVATFGDYLHDKLWFLSEQAFGLQFAGKPIYEQDSQPIDLTGFPTHQTGSQVETPIMAVSLLKIIAETAVHQIYNYQALIGTEENLVGGFDTQIWCAAFHHIYRTPKSATVNEAETSSVYRFLKYISNVLGYIIGDPNSHVLLAMVSHINSLNVSVAELHLHTKEVTSMVQQVKEGISQTYNEAVDAISSEDTLYIKHLIDDLLALLQHYSAATIDGLHTFEQQKAAFRNIRFQTTYPCNPEYL